MARSSAKRTPRAKAQVLTWRPAHEEAFRLATGLKPPATVQVRKTQKGFTMTAVFTNEQGRKLRATTRLAWVCGEDRLTVTDEVIATNFVLGGQRSKGTGE